MLGQLQALRLVVGADVVAVELVGPRGQPLVDEAADDLAVLEDERHLVAAHFEHGAAAPAPGGGVAEARIEEAGIVDAELADQRIERHHLGGVVRRDVHRLARDEDVELVGVEDQLGGCGGAGSAPRNRPGRSAPRLSTSMTPVWRLAR